MINVNYIKIAKSILLMSCMFLIGISVIAGSYNANARQQEIQNQELFNNPEAILNVSFKDDIYLDNIIDNELNPDKNWQGITFDRNTFGITGLSGLSNIGGVEELVSINGQFRPKAIKKEYNTKLQELISKIDDIKNNNHVNDNEIVKNELSKMSGWEVKKQRYLNWTQSKVLQLSIVGNYNTINTLKTILDKSGHVKQLDLSIIENLKKEVDELKLTLKDKSEEEKQTVINQLVKTELAKKGLTGDINEIMKTEFEKIPEKIKNPIQNVLNDFESKSIETTSSQIFESMFTGSIAHASWCSRSHSINREWTGIKIKINDCFAQQIGSFGDLGTIFGWILTPFLFIFPIGTLIIKIALQWFNSNAYVIRDQSNKCNNRGLNFKLYYFGLIQINGCN